MAQSRAVQIIKMSCFALEDSSSAIMVFNQLALYGNSTGWHWTSGAATPEEIDFQGIAKTGLFEQCPEIENWKLSGQQMTSCMFFSVILFRTVKIFGRYLVIVTALGFIQPETVVSIPDRSGQLICQLTPTIHSCDPITSNCNRF